MTPTDEMHRMLTEAGVEYRFNDATKVFEWHFDGTDGEGSAHATEVNGGINIIACSLTPEQAIAATLGVTDARPMDAESSGALTAEKVRELMEENSRQYPSPTDPYVWLTEYDWQAIADELNATLGRGTCHNIKASWPSLFECDECGYSNDDTYYGSECHFKFCPNCGAKVVNE